MGYDKLQDRIFWNITGWFVCLRQDDEKNTFRIGLRPLDVKINEFGLILGPFQTRRHLEKWLDEYLGQHARPRRSLLQNHGEMQSLKKVRYPDTE